MRIVRLPLLFVVSALTAGVVLSSQAPKPSAATGLIVGIVIDAATGKPASGAVVSISGGAAVSPFDRDAPAAMPRILTSADGRFVYHDLPRGDYSITASKSGFAEGAYGRRRPGGPSVALALADGEKTAEVIVRIWKFAAISGTVLDEAGEPVVGARVRSWRRAFDRGRYGFVAAAAASTDDRGVYRLGGLMPGDYVVGVPALQVPALSSESRPSSSLEVTPSVGFNTAATRLGPGLDVFLRGAPVPPPPVDGRLSLYPTIWHPSAASSAQAASVTVTSGLERSGIDIQLYPLPTARVSGTVTRGEGAISAIPVRLIPSGDEIDESGFLAAADGNGSFVFPAVPAGQYTLRVAATMSIEQKQTLLSTLWGEMPLTVGESDVSDAALVIGRSIRIYGRLEFEGSKPGPTKVDRVPLLVESVDRRLTFPSAPIFLDAGQFSSGGYPPGRYFVRVSGSPIGWMFKSATYNGRDVSETPIELVNEDVQVVLTYTDRWTGLAGTVDTADGRQDADAIVLVFPTDSKLWVNYGATPRRLKSARTRKTGEYNFNSLPPGSYHVIALPDEQAADWMDPAFLEAASRVATRITIAEGEQRTSNLRTREIR